jgi:alpha-L-fucosidase
VFDLQGSGLHRVGVLVRNLCTIVARGGNYLIGIGPGPDGAFDPTVYARLKELGAWLKVNGEAIYGTRPLAPYEQGECVFTTRRDGSAYATILAKGNTGTLPETVAIPAELAAKAAEISLLGHGPVPAGVTHDKVTVFALPAAARAKPPSVHAWVLKLAATAPPWPAAGGDRLSGTCVPVELRPPVRTRRPGRPAGLFRFPNDHRCWSPAR